jgi:hypothetical protein
MNGLSKALIQSPNFWFTLLALMCLLGPYALHVRPNTKWQRVYVAVTIGLLAWLLPLTVSLRSQ